MKQITSLVLAATTFALVGCTTSSRYGRSTGEYIDDKTITSNVKSSLGKDSLTDGTQINVETFRGNVHLTGFVQHPIQKQQASQIARRVDGVRYFKNDIIVKSELPTMRADQSTMREPSGAEPQNMRSSSQESSGWQRANHNETRREIQEPSGAEAEVRVEREGTGVDAESDVDVERNEGKIETEVERD